MFLSFLNKPFPRLELDKRSVRNNFLVGCFVALFLIVFEPFGISQWHDNKKIIKLAGFGLISFIIPTLVSIIIAHIVHKKPIEDNWTIAKEITTILIILVCIAFGNLFYGRMLYIMPVTPKGFLFAFASVLLIGIFPVSLHVFRKHNKFLKINLANALAVNDYIHTSEHKNEIKQSSHVPLEDPIPNMPDNLIGPEKVTDTEIKQADSITFIAENEKDKVALLAQQLLYIEAADNYSNIVFIENEKIKKQLIRSSLKRIESQVKFDFIVRCHRTFIVNLKNVKNVEGNAAGYRLSFDLENCFVPVSRNYGTTILDKLKVLK
jgi:hypothetical protein